MQLDEEDDQIEEPIKNKPGKKQTSPDEDMEEDGEYSQSDISDSSSLANQSNISSEHFMLGNQGSKEFQQVEEVL